MARHPVDTHVAALAGGAVLLLSLLGAGLYAIAPLSGSDEEAAADVVESYVEAWAATRCEEVVDLMEGPRDQILAACYDGRPTRQLRIESTEVDVDGDHGIARLEVTYREGGHERTGEVEELLVRVDGEWKVAWGETSRS